MPTYQYHCAANGRTVEVQHSMKERLATWSELCQRAGIEVDGSPPDSPVERIITGGLLGTVAGGTPSSAAANALPMAGCCGNPSSCRHRG